MHFETFLQLGRDACCSLNCDDHFESPNLYPSLSVVKESIINNKFLNLFPPTEEQ